MQREGKREREIINREREGEYHNSGSKSKREGNTEHYSVTSYDCETFPSSM